MTYAGAPVPPPLPAGEIKPSGVWFVVAGVIGLLFVVAGPVLAVVGLASLGMSLPTVTAEFDAGTPYKGRLDAGRSMRSTSSAGTTAAPPPATDCSGRGTDGGNAELAATSTNFYLPDGTAYWGLVYYLTVPRSGEYEVTCKPGEVAVERASYAVGDDPDVGGLVGKILGGAGVLFGLPCIGIFLGGGMALIVGIRRGAHRRRLQQQYMAAMYGYGYGYPPR